MDGVVTLDGEVDSYSKKWAAYRAAGRVVGVKEVVDHIKVKLPGSFKLADEEIGRAAVHAIELNVSVPHDRIRSYGAGWFNYFDRRSRLGISKGGCRGSSTPS